MISFKQFLMEMPERLDWDKGEYDSFEALSAAIHASSEYVGHIGSNKVFFNGGQVDTFYVLDRLDRPVFKLTGTLYKAYNRFSVEMLVSNPHTRKSMQAQDLYAFIVRDRGIVLVSDDIMSKGGEIVWTRLSKVPGVKVGRIGHLTQDPPKPLLARMRDHFSKKNEKTRFVAWKE